MAKQYTPTIWICPKCGEKIEGDMPIISHGMLGCDPRNTDKSTKQEPK